MLSLVLFVCFCALTLSSNVFDSIFNDLNGLVKLSDLDLHWVGPHLDLLENNRGQRSDGKPLKLHELHAEEFLITWGSKVIRFWSRRRCPCSSLFSARRPLKPNPGFPEKRSLNIATKEGSSLQAKQSLGAARP